MLPEREPCPLSERFEIPCVRHAVCTAPCVWLVAQSEPPRPKRPNIKDRYRAKGPEDYEAGYSAGYAAGRRFEMGAHHD